MYQSVSTLNLRLLILYTRFAFCQYFFAKFFKKFFYVDNIIMPIEDFIPKNTYYYFVSFLT